MCACLCLRVCACVLGVCQIMTVARFFGMLHTPVCVRVCVWGRRAPQGCRCRLIDGATFLLPAFRRTNCGRLAQKGQKGLPPAVASVYTDDLLRFSCVHVSVCECVSKILLYLCEIGAPGTHNFEGTRTTAPASLSVCALRL